MVKSHENDHMGNTAGLEELEVKSFGNEHTNLLRYDTFTETDKILSRKDEFLPVKVSRHIHTFEMSHFHAFEMGHTY